MLSIFLGWIDCRENAFCHVRKPLAALRLDAPTRASQRQVVKLRQRPEAQISELSAEPPLAERRLPFYHLAHLVILRQLSAASCRSPLLWKLPKVGRGRFARLHGVRPLHVSVNTTSFRRSSPL